jgi:nitroreductase
MATVAGMETWDAIRARRNVRAYEDRAIPPEHLDRVLDAGRRSPSAMNLQRWDFVVVTDRSELRELAKVWRGGQHVASSAATVALVTPVVDDPATIRSMEYDLGQVTVSMMVAAADLGIGSGHSAVRDHDLARLVLGLPPDRRAAYLIAFGYPADRPLAPIAHPTRRPFEDVVHRGRW